MNMFYFLLAILVLIFTLIKQRKYTYNLKKIIPTILIGMAFALTILIYPISPGSDFISKIVYAIIYSAQTIILGEDILLVSSLHTESILDQLYIWLIYFLLLIMPFLTVSFLSRFFLYS